MNMRWLKQNQLLIISAVLFAGALSFVVWFVRKASAQKDQVVAELEEQQAQLKRLRDLDPYPSSENVEVVKRDREHLHKLYRTLKHATAQEALTVPDLQRDIEFSQRLREALAVLSSEAQKYQVRTPENFAFGFSRYVAAFPCRNPPAKPEECRKLLSLLAKQLLVVEKLSRMILPSGIEELTQIRRTEVEPGQPGADSLAAPVSQDPKAQYQVLPFEVQFIADTKSLRTLLNNLSKADLFFAVRSLKVEAQTAPSAGSGVEPARATAPGDAKPPERTRLTVTMRVDLIEFPAPPEKEKEKDKARP
jgi:hypothetical protein